MCVNVVRRLLRQNNNDDEDDGGINNKPYLHITFMNTTRPVRVELTTYLIYYLKTREKKRIIIIVIVIYFNSYFVGVGRGNRGNARSGRERWGSIIITAPMCIDVSPQNACF